VVNLTTFLKPRPDLGHRDVIPLAIASVIVLFAG